LVARLAFPHVLGFAVRLPNPAERERSVVPFVRFAEEDAHEKLVAIEYARCSDLRSASEDLPGGDQAKPPGCESAYQRERYIRTCGHCSRLDRNFAPQ